MSKNVVFLGIYGLLILALFLPLYLTNRKKKKAFKDMMDALKIGDKIVTIGGICGTVNKILENTLEIKIDKGVSMTITKGAVSRVEK